MFKLLWGNSMVCSPKVILKIRPLNANFTTQVCGNIVIEVKHAVNVICEWQFLCSARNDWGVMIRDEQCRRGPNTFNVTSEYPAMGDNILSGLQGIPSIARFAKVINHDTNVQCISSIVANVCVVIDEDIRKASGKGRLDWWLPPYCNNSASIVKFDSPIPTLLFSC